MARRARPARANVETRRPIVRTSAKRVDGGIRDLETRLAEALEQQTAMAEVLRIISLSLTELQPVLDVVVASAARFCSADDVVIFRLDGATLRPAAHHGPIPVDLGLAIPCARGSVAGRAVVDRRVVHVRDLQAEVDEFPEGSAFARRLGHRTVLGVPLLRDGVALGMIQLRRAEVKPFTAKQMELLETFAAQAVIAIENVRLFTELEARNRDLAEALEQQTATGDILRVISRSPTDVRPVLDAVAEHAARLCGADDALVLRVEGALMRRAMPTCTSRSSNRRRPASSSR